MEGENQIFKMNIIHELKAPVLNLNMLLETLYEYDDALEINKKREIIELGIKETKRLRKLIHFQSFKKIYFFNTSSRLK